MIKKWRNEIRTLHNIVLAPCPVRHLGTERAFGVLRAMYNIFMLSRASPNAS